MSPPSYPHRHLLLTGLLDSQPSTTQPDAFAVAAETNGRGCKLDTLLLTGWSTSSRKAQPAEKDALQHADNLRIKTGDFDVLGRIGEGQFGVVDAVRCKLDGKVYAMKTIEKSMVMRAGTQLNLAHERHVHMLATGSSPSPSLVTSFQSPTALHLVTDFAPCGSLWDRLCEMLPEPGLDTGRMSETEVQWWARQMTSAISWLHGLGYAHRDIKPHNFLLLPDARLWLTDFGSAGALSHGAVPRRHCLLPAGTPDYVAPEVLRLAEDAMVEAAQIGDDESEADRTLRPGDVEPPGYGPDVDWWSLGATLYEMAAGRAPFFAPSIMGTYERIMRCDVRMPDDMSHELKSLLSALLSPSDARLGHSDVGEIRRHPFFNGIDWSRQGTPPSGIAPQPIDLGTLADTFEHGFDGVEEITFDHFFANSPGFTQSSVSVSMSLAVAPSTWARWVGWSWDPPSDYFGNEAPPAASPSTSRPFVQVAPRFSSSPSPALLTPMRQGPQRTPPAVPRTAPRSMPRTRPVSERQAFAELIQCVQASARKKLASAVKMPGSASTLSSLASTSPSAPMWRKEQPPTPTPMSRDVTALTSTLITARNDNRPPSRPLSRTSVRSRGDSISAPASRGSFSRDDMPQRTHSRTSSRGRGGSYSLSREGSRDETFLSRLSEAAQPPRPTSAASLRSRGSRESLTSGSLGKRASAEILAAMRNGRQTPLVSDTQSNTPRAPHSSTPRKADEALQPSRRIESVRPGHERSEYAAKSTKEHEYVAPRDPKLAGDRLANLEAWHGSLSGGLSNLEQRLADLRARLSDDV